MNRTLWTLVATMVSAVALFAAAANAAAPAKFKIGTLIGNQPIE